tara:strand:+ start:4344 stop:5105 length:762 start_codon:yes stop_codon:yes gene_type:complete
MLQTVAWRFIVQHQNALPPKVRQQITALLLKKGQYVSMGDLRGAREIDLAIRKILAAGNVPFNPNATTITLQSVTHAALMRERKRRDASLDTHGVPAWFRPGYKAPLRVHLWLRLRADFRKRLKRRHALGLLSVYYPSPSFWSKAVKPSDFMQPQSVQPGAVEEAVAVVNQVAPSVPAEVVVETMDNADVNAAAVANLEQELMGEEADATELERTLEPEGSGLLASDAPWYEDNKKVLYAAVGALLVLHMVRK